MRIPRDVLTPFSTITQPKYFREKVISRTYYTKVPYNALRTSEHFYYLPWSSTAGRHLVERQRLLGGQRYRPRWMVELTLEVDAVLPLTTILSKHTLVIAVLYYHARLSCAPRCDESFYRRHSPVADKMRSPCGDFVFVKSSLVDLVFCMIEPY